MGGEDVPVIADERDLMKSALGQMREAFIDLLTEYQQDGDWDKQGEFQHQFWDGYAEAKRVWGLALLKRDVLGKHQPAI
jgi:hypothetical protein